MIKIIIITAFFFIISSCSSNQSSIKQNPSNNEYEYAKFASFHEGLFNFTYILKEMNENLKQKYLDEYVSGYKIYMEVAQELSYITVDMSIQNSQLNTETFDPLYKKILKLNANISHKIQLHQIEIMEDEIALESFKSGIRVSRHTGFWEIFKHYFFDYCVRVKNEEQKFCQDSFNYFLEDYKQTQQQQSEQPTSEI